MKKKVFYSFQNVAEAEKLISELKDKGCSDKDMILTANKLENHNIGSVAVSPPISIFADITTGMIVVGALGGLFEWFMETQVFHAMEFGPATIFPLIGILIGIIAGAFLGGLIGAYIYFGRPEYVCKKLLKADRLVLTVKNKIHQ